MLALVIGIAGCQNFAKKTVQPVPAHNPCIVLALPATGAYMQVAEKIKRGANLAKNQLKTNGIDLQIENINTELPDWLKKLDSLPAYCAVVGGPLQDKAYLAAKNAKAVERRVFFTFVPTLKQGDEGNAAWRFFPGPADQIDALLKFGIDDLKISSYGAFYPEDNYGKKMTELLEKKLMEKHMPLLKASYNPSAPASWSESASVLISPAMAEDGKTPVPQTKFEALFLPDSWKHMDMLTQSLLYNGEDRLALFGTAIWEPSLAGRPLPKASKYALAVFPSAFSQSRAPKILQAPGNDFWVALGYDFVNFAVKTGIDNRMTAAQVTARARQAAPAIKAVAPIQWNNNGIAAQELFLFQPGPNGIMPLNVNTFKQNQTLVKENAALRMQGVVKEEMQQNTAMQETAGQPKNVQMPALPAASLPAPGNVPRSSYKLSLPARQ